MIPKSQRINSKKKLGYINSVETRKKMSKGKKGKRFSLEHRRKLSEALVKRHKREKALRTRQINRDKTSGKYTKL